jgi:hypothetical protein
MNRELIAKIDLERRKVFASLHPSYRFIVAVRQIFKTAFGNAYTKADIDRLFDAAMKAQKVDTSLDWNWGKEVLSSTMKIFRGFQAKSRSLNENDFDDLLSHVVASLATGTNSLTGGKYEHGDVGKICRDYLDMGRSPLDIVKLVKNKVFQLSQDWIRKQSRHQVTNDRGLQLDDSTRKEEGGSPLAEKIVDMSALNRMEQQELKSDLKRIVEKVHVELTRMDPALGMIWDVYLKNPDIENSAAITKEIVAFEKNGRIQKLPLVDALNALYIDGTNLKPYTDRSVYYLITKIRTYLKAKYADVIEAALS